jgi:hypothetical protein
MLGEMIGELEGNVTSVRVEGTDTGPKLEVQLMQQGTLLGNGISDIATYWNKGRPDGLFLGGANGLMFTQDAQGAMYTGNGIGRMTGDGGAAEWRGSLIFLTQSPKLAALNGILVLFEFSIDQTGMHQHTKLWEWK